jgi:hypothetical protein
MLPFTILILICTLSAGAMAATLVRLATPPSADVPQTGDIPVLKKVPCTRQPKAGETAHSATANSTATAVSNTVA